MNDTIQQIVNSENIPTPPGVALRLLELYNQDDVDVSEVSQILGADPVLTAKLIAYCNSPILGRANQTTSVQQAIVAAGMRATRIIGLSFSLMQNRGKGATGFDFDRFWNQSLATAVAARIISAHSKSSADEAFLIGLVLNLGSMAIAVTFTDEYDQLMRQARETGTSPVELEQQKWSVNRYTVSKRLLEKWNFPSKMAEAIDAYGNPESERDGELNTLCLAEQISTILFEQDPDIDQIRNAKAFAESKLGFSEEVFEQLFDKIVPTWSEYAQLLEFDFSEATTIKDLENHARQQIASLSLGIAVENDEMQRQNQELKTKAFVDGLTGLKNRRAYETEAVEALEDCKKNNKLFVLMVADIDHFKSVNDTYGHAAGDAVLTEVGQILCEDLRRKDSVFRFGGEEFVVILPDCPPQYADLAADRLRTAIEETEIKFQSDTLKVTVSIGVTFCDAFNNPSLEKLFEQADQQLYRAKNGGRNRCCVYKPEHVPHNAPVVPISSATTNADCVNN